MNTHIRLVSTMLLVALSVLLHGQNAGESAVCSCIERNAASVGLDFFQAIAEIKGDLIKQGIITEDFSSVISQLKAVEIDGVIDKARSYENIALEEIGMHTIRFCVVLAHYDTLHRGAEPAYQMIAELDALIGSSEIQTDFGALIKSTARVLNNYLKPEHVNSQLWSSAAYLFMYFFTETALMKSIIHLPPWTEQPSDTTSAITVFVNANSECYLDGGEVLVEALCERIGPSILAHQGILLKSERATPYKAYLAVYNRIQQCVYDLRSAKSVELYGMSYEALDEDKKGRIQEMIPLRMVEAEPSRQ